MKLKKLSHVHIQLSGLNLERMISSISNNDINIFKLKKTGSKTCSFYISISDYEKLCLLDNIQAFSVTIIAKRTIRDFFKECLNYLGMVLGIFVSFFAFYYASLWVNCVNIIGGGQSHVCENGDRCFFQSKNYNEFLEYIGSLGIYEGARISNIQPRTIEREIMSAFESVASCEIQITGTTLNLSIHESKLEPLGEVNTMDLIAPENGIVQKMIVSSGKALVKAGDTVKKGQVLVQGVNGHKAIASVEIKLYYHASDIHMENSLQLAFTGDEYTYSYIDILGMKIGNKKTPDYSYYTKEVTEIEISPNLFAPIKKVVVQYKKQEEQMITIPLSDVQEQIEKRLQNSLVTIARLGKDENKKMFTQVTKLCDGVYEIDCYLEVYRILKI